MNIRVVYHSRSGNTLKLAQAIAEELGVQPRRIGKEKITFSEPVDLLFIGDGIYFHKPHRKTKALIKELGPAVVKNAVAFGTYGNQSEIGDQITTLLREKGINIAGKPFTCKGDSPGTDNQGHPDEADLHNARKFAQDIVSSIA
ncbi:MAG TPA: nitric oxide synthase [Ruminococcaceae bacterium]|jgi:flavodoxin|nr:nitric oxide synthase [Oscillospiraceae bacterium]